MNARLFVAMVIALQLSSIQGQYDGPDGPDFGYDSGDSYYPGFMGARPIQYFAGGPFMQGPPMGFHPYPMGPPMFY